MSFLARAALAVLAWLPATAAAAGELKLVNLVPVVDSFVARTQGMTGAERLAAFDRDVRPLAGGYYAKLGAPKLLNHLAIYPVRRQKIMDISRRFEAMFTDARKDYEAALGPVEADQPVYLVHSFGEMDGGTRQLPGGMTLLFGADVIARVHDAEDIRPFLHHELFHLMHLPRFWADGCTGNWCMVWGEGLATYAAVQLNPAVADKALMIEPALREAVDADRGAAFCAARSAMAGDDDDDRARLLTTTNRLDGYPPRLGYYLGYLVARELGQSRSLSQLSAMSPKDVRPEFERIAASFAKGCR